MAKNRMDGDGLSHLLEKIKAYITGVLPTKTSQLTNDSGYLTSSTGVTSVNSQTGAVTISTATTSAAGLMSTDDKTKLNGISTGAEVNQNAFSIVQVGTTKVQADGKTDTLTLAAGDNVTLTPDATNDKITIAATDTTYDEATTSAAGLMSAGDKTKLNGVAEGATANTGTITEVKTTGGAHTTIDVTSGVAQFNIPTATSHLTNDSNFITAADVPVDSAPTSEGTNAVSSGGVYTALANRKIWTGVCNSTSTATAKTATLDDATGFSLTAGVMVLIRFTSSSDYPAFTLNVNGTGAKSVRVYDGSSTTDNTYLKSIGANEPVLLVYNGAAWIMGPAGYGITRMLASKASPAFTGKPTAPTAAAGTNTTQIATTAFVTTAVANAVTGTASFQGTVNTGTDISGLTSYTKGMYWIVGTTGTYVGQKCEAGDMIYCISDYSSSYKAADFNVVQNNTEALTNDEIDTIWNGVFS